MATISNGIFSNTSVVLVRSGIFEVSQTERNATLVGFDHDLSILTRAYVTTIYLHKYYTISRQNETLILQIDDTSQDHYFVIASCDVAYNYSGKQYIHSGHHVILVKFDKSQMDMALIYVPIWESTQQGINNITCTILTLDYPCETDFTNDALYIKVIFQNYDEFDNY